MNKYYGRNELSAYLGMKRYTELATSKYCCKFIGKDTIIYEYAKIANPEIVEIGHHCKIDDFTFIFGGEGVKIGNYTHFASFSGIFGGGAFECGEYVGVSEGVRFATGTNEYRMRMHMTAAAPPEEQGYYHSKIIVEDDVIVFANASLIAPRGKPLVIGEGAVIGAGAIIKKDVKPWSIVIKKDQYLGERPKLLDWIEQNKQERKRNDKRMD